MVEKKIGKDKILEHYINLIELGRGIYGVKSAAYYYFKKKPKYLNAKEGAFLAMLLPSPKRYSQSFRIKELTLYAKEQVSKILKKMKMAKIITDERRIELSGQKLLFEERL